MKELLAFQTDAAVIDRLGRELVAKQETALGELIKNSFDADATEVEVVFEGTGEAATLEVRDNGSGMNRDELVNGFLRLASDLKVQQPRSPRFKRQRAGRKGIGRFSTQRLGRRLVLTTCKQVQENALRLSVDWDLFTAGKPLDSVAVELSELAPTTPGTTVRIEQLRDSWSRAQVKRSWRQVLTLQQSFPVAPVESNLGADPGFSVRFIQSGTLFADETIVADMQTEILDHLHAVFELKVDAQGRAAWRITENRFGQTRVWAPIHHEHRDDVNPPPYSHLRQISMKAHYVVLRPELLPSLVFTRVRDVLAQEGGIRLYRNGFRVVPYGDPDNDWLGLDEAYVKRHELAPIANRNFFGVIEVHDPDGHHFQEHTSREGLIETPAFAELKKLTSSALITAASVVQADRGRKVRAGSSTSRAKPSAKAMLDNIVTAAKEAKKAAERAAEKRRTEDSENAARQAATTAQLIEDGRQALENADAEVADEMSMLRFLATLGMTTAEFSHETSMTFDAVRLDFSTIVDEALKARLEDMEFASQANRVKAMFERLDTLTSYLNGLAAARSARSMNPVSLSRAVQDFGKGMQLHSQSMGAELVIEMPPFDPLYTIPMHEAEIASVLLNLHTNAFKAMKRAGGERRILIIANRIDEPDARVSLRFADTGDGISDENKERVFEPFFTTQAAPAADAPDALHLSGTGLGLWIIDKIAANAGGEVSLIDPPAGYSTCFEFAVPAEED